MTLLRALLFLLAMGGSVWAQTEGQPIPWQQLNQQEQQVLQRFNEQWDQLPPERQQRLLNGARRWSNMNQEERQQAQQRFQQWRQLPPEQQQRLRERFQRFRQLPPEQREAIRNARQWFRSLPEQERHELRQRWKNMSPDERQAFRRQLRQRFGGAQGAPPGPSRQHNGPSQPRPFRPGH